MAGETPIGLGYVELAVKDRGATQAIDQAKKQVTNYAAEANTAMTKLRTSVAASNAALNSMASAAASGASPLAAMSQGVMGVTGAIGGLAGPLGAIAALFTTIVGIGLGAWLRNSAENARELAEAMKAVGDAQANLPGQLGTFGAAGSGGDGAPERLRALASLAEKDRLAGEAEMLLQRDEYGSAAAGLGGPMQARASRSAAAEASALQRALAGGARDANDAAGLGLAAGAERLTAGAKSLREYAAVLKEVASNPRLFQTLEWINGERQDGDSSSPPSERVAANLAGELRRAVDLAVELEQLAKQAEQGEKAALEATRTRLKEQADLARQMAEGFEESARSAAGSRAELSETERHAQEVRDMVLRRGAQGRRPATVEAATVEAIAIRGGGTTDLLGGLRAFQAGIFGGTGGSPDQQTAQSTKDTAEQARKMAELEAKSVELLKEIARSVQNGPTATLG